MLCSARFVDTLLSSEREILESFFFIISFQNPFQFMGNAAAIRDAIGGASGRERSSHLAKAGKSFLWAHGRGFLPEK